MPLRVIDFVVSAEFHEIVAGAQRRRQQGRDVPLHELQMAPQGRNGAYSVPIGVFVTGHDDRVGALE